MGAVLHEAMENGGRTLLVAGRIGQRCRLFSGVGVQHEHGLPVDHHLPIANAAAAEPSRRMAVIKRS